MSPSWTGGPVTARATCVVAPNPTPMTLDGTNTWVLAEPGSGEAIVVDPGPLDEGHLQAVAGMVRRQGKRVALTLVTHHHWDHADGVPRFRQLTSAPVLAARRSAEAAAAGPDGSLADGEVLVAGGLEVVVVATPGHTADSLSFLLPADRVLLTGDTVLGRGTTVVAHPDGELAAYLASLDRIAELAASGRVTSILPGHGPPVDDAAATVAAYREHRRQRLEQVRAAVASGAVTAEAVVERVYADVPREVWPAATQSVLAQLAYLRELSERGEVMTA